MTNRTPLVLRLGSASLFYKLSLLWSLLGCQAAEPTKAAPPADEGQVGESGNGGPSSCGGERWSGPDEPWIIAQCQLGEDPRWRCECIEQDPQQPLAYVASVVDQDVAACETALLHDCEIEVDAPLFCSKVELGTCWPSDGDSWWCHCGQGVESRGRVEESCNQELWEQCGMHCETVFGTCGEVGADTYSCQCSGAASPLPPEPDPPLGSPDGAINGTAVSLDGPRSCDEAMAHYCGERCANSAGGCTPTTDGFDCNCSAGGSGTKDFSELGGISPTACATALQQTCGAELLAPLSKCTLRSNVSCQAAPRTWAPEQPRPDTFEYTCQCAQDGPAVSVDARGCYRALLAACPEEVSADAQPTLIAPGQVGALCTKGQDCESGICQFGKLGRDGVCTAACTTHADCQAGALCAFSAGERLGRCFVECHSEFECELLNDALEDPLYCADAVDLPYGDLKRDDEGGRLCTPISDTYWPLPVQR